MLFNGASLKQSSLRTDKLIFLYSRGFYLVRVVKSRRMRWAGHVARMGEGRGVHRVLVGKPEGETNGETQMGR
jgi:hypothetical protein